MNKIQAWSEYRDTGVKAEVLRQLVSLGYDLTQRTFYRHCAQGKCRSNKEGVFSRRLVKQYVEAEEIGRNGETPEEDGPAVALSVEKRKLINEKLKINNEHAKLKFRKDDDQLLEREALYLEMASRTVALDNGFRQMIDMEAPSLIASVKGDAARQVEFVEMIVQFWNELLNSYSTTDEFEVLFEDDNQPQIKEVL